MYKNSFKIEFDKSTKDILLVSTSWQDKDILYSLLCDYIPKSIREIIPLDDSYIVTWLSQKDFDIFVEDVKYKSIIEFLNKFSIKIIWQEISARQDY